MLGFSPLASAPLSDDGIVIVSSSITLIGKESQVIHNDVEGVNNSTKVITTVSSVTDINDLQVNLTKSITTVSSVTDVNDLQVNLTKSITTVSSVTDINDLQVNLTKSITTVSSVTDINDLQVNLTKSITTVSSVTDVNDLQVNLTKSITTVSSVTDVNDVEGVNNSTKLVSSIFSQVTQESPSTAVDVPLFTTSATGQVRTPQIGPSENLVAVSVTGNVTRPLLVASSNKSLVNVSSSATVNSLVTLVETALSGVSSSVDVNDLPFVGVPVNATVNLGDSLTPNLYYSGQVDNSVYYTSSNEYEGGNVKVELEFKIDNSASNTEQQFLFDSRNPAYGHSSWINYLFAYKTGSTVRVGLALISSLLRRTSGQFDLNYSFSKETWYKLSIFNSGQRLYAIVYNATTGQQLHSENILMSVSYGSYSSSSYKFFLDDFLLGNGTNQTSSEYFEGLLHNVKVYVPSNTLRAEVWNQKTSISNPTSDWADAQSNFSNNANSSDLSVFESPYLSSHLITTSGSASAVTTLVTSNVTVFPTGVSSQASVTDLVSLTTEVLTGVSSSVTFNNLSVNLSTTLTTVTSTSQVSDLVVDIDEIIPPSLSVSSQASVGQIVAGGGSTLSSISSSSEIVPVVIGILIGSVEAEVTLTSVTLVVPITGVSSSSQTNALEATITELIGSVSSSASVNSVTLVSNGSTTLDSVTSTSTSNQVSVSTDEVANLTGVEAGTAVQFGGVESQKAVLRRLESPCQVGTLTINVSVTLPSASSAFNASDEVKGIINTSVQLSTLPLVTVGRGSITLSTDGFNFEEFKNAYDRARTVYISRAA